ncbi:MAG: hypothetical protein WCG25_09390 [bacterium]
MQTILKKQRFIKIIPEDKEFILQAINNQDIKITPAEYADQLKT